MKTDPPILAFVAGFLGAGKTTLILRAAQHLQQRGFRVGVITNDQDSGLVDTKLAQAQNVLTQEVPGGCFCCRFSDLLHAAERLSAYSPDFLFAEPVGSCIDLSATILQPLQTLYPNRYRVAPLTVLVDPSHANSDPGPDIQYLFCNQIAEADLLCLTKQDLYPNTPELPFPTDFQLSAKTGTGVDLWLNELLHPTRISGARPLDVVYETYANAEAALGWLNLHAQIALNQPQSPAALAGPLLDRLEEALTKAQIPIAHLKLFDQTPTGYIKVSVTANRAEPTPEGDLFADPSLTHDLALNLRALAGPELLQHHVENALATVSGSTTILHLRTFRPPPPKPEHRVTGSPGRLTPP